MDPISVSELSYRIKSVMESDFQFVYVTGEISNFKHHTSGHFYFALKDDSSQISAVMWNGKNRLLRFKPEDGMKVDVKGKLTVYEKRGTYQIDIIEMKISGVGDIYARYEQLKEKLRLEGLFDAVHKKPIPEFPERIIIITSETGAALQDFYRVASRRFPGVKLMLINSRMQGSDAAPEIIRALEKACSVSYKADVIVIARGGGSIEDLWVFNDENLARAIFSATVPVVSAIGHETDFTICDFVADLRAPTPSAASEMILPDINELRRNLDESEDNLLHFVRSSVNKVRRELDSIESNYHFRKPAERLKELNEELRGMKEELRHILSARLEKIKGKLDAVVSSYSFKRPLDNIKNAASNTNEIGNQMKKIMLARFKSSATRLDSIESLLKSLDPANVLKRGFVIVTRESKIIQRNKELNIGDNINLKFSDGTSGATINEK